ncbi:hypothetical protein LTR56_002084 [Elasticomyces elasticus]|nr:hypothetical protein LTR22_012226 [Elasticomyces elasticus]KAK3658227.1 hypothetical protein LTR56_002084 [Elasticomyces elasticus]KAK4919506.1 hypothetical protein LTR49_012884 [Elasticomyces elasticus]KAK5764112.1 hypothetical protein LTS12_005806 [Elasticomyces elasticus]
MSFFKPPPKPNNPLAWHRILSPTAGVKVSPICLGGISIGTGWEELFGENEDPFALMDAYYGLGGNFIDTSNTYNFETSESLIGEWMENRGVRDQMVLASKYSAGYKAYDRENIPIQTNYTGNSAKSMYISVRDSLKKLRTDYIDLLYVHWWGFDTSVEEVMRHLHALVMSRQVLYLGTSDVPAWVVVKANMFAKANGLTPFSVYQGKWNAAYRDMEADIIHMAEDQGMAIVSWASLGGGALNTKDQRENAHLEDGGRPAAYGQTDKDIKVSEALESIAVAHKTSLQAVALAYLFAQSTFVVPIVGVQTVEHVRAMPDALRIKLSPEDIKQIHEASPLVPQFPMDFLFRYGAEVPYNTRLTAADVSQSQMACWFDAPPKQPVSNGIWGDTARSTC